MSDFHHKLLCQTRSFGSKKYFLNNFSVATCDKLNHNQEFHLMDVEEFAIV